MYEVLAQAVPKGGCVRRASLVYSVKKWLDDDPFPRLKTLFRDKLLRAEPMNHPVRLPKRKPFPKPFSSFVYKANSQKSIVVACFFGGRSGLFTFEEPQPAALPLHLTASVNGDPEPRPFLSFDF